MKTYRLKKELPGIPEGSIITEDDFGKFWLKNKELETFNNKTDKMLSLAKESGRLEEIKDKKDTAYNGLCVEDSEEPVDHFFIEENDLDAIPCGYSAVCEGFSFLDRTKAENFSKKLKAMKAVWKRHAENDGDFVPDWEDRSQEKRYIYKTNGHRTIGEEERARGIFFLPYFSSAEKARDCILDLGDTLDDLLL